MSLTIGIDIGGTRIKAALMDEHGTLTEQMNLQSCAQESYKVMIDQLKDIVIALSAKTDRAVTAVGIAVAGLMDRNRELVITEHNCPVFRNSRVADDVSNAIALPAVMDNDANLMAVGEGAFGAARGSGHFIALTLGTGIGGAVVINGELLRGADGGGAELGHIPISIEGPPCGCGSVGCLESYVGLAAIHRFTAETFPEYKELGVKELHQLAAQGDAKAIKVFHYIGTMLGVGMAGLVNTFNPQLLVIGGGISAAGDLVFKPLREELQRRAFKNYLQMLQIRPAQLGNWAGVVGAARIAGNALA